MSAPVNQKNTERRQRYRVSDIGRYGLSAAVLSGDSVIPVDIYDVAFAGADIASQRLQLQLDQPITLHFMAKGMAAPAVVRATVRWKREDKDHGTVRYGLLFQNPSHLPKQLPTKLLAAFNRRRSYRIAPRGAPLMAAITRKDGFKFSLPIISLSATGMGCLARDATEQMLLTGDVIELSFHVPETTHKCILVATVRYAIKQRGGVRYGLDFDAQKTAMFNREQRVITRYVMDEQRRMLRHS